MARRRKNHSNRKNTSPAAVSEQMTDAIAEAFAQELEPIKKKLEDIESRLDDENEGVKLDDDTLEAAGVDTPEELEEILEEAAEIAADNLEADGDALAAAVIDAGLDTTEVVDEMVKSRKARKSAGEELEPVTAEEVAEIIEEIAGDVADDLSAEEIQQLADDGFVDGKEVDVPEGTGAKRRGKSNPRKTAARGQKSTASASRQTKRANTPPVQRKYAQLFTSRKSNQMEREEKKLPPIVRLARAVKCSDIFAQGAVGGFRDPERAAWAAEKFYKDAKLARAFKGMSVTQPSSAGFLVPQDYVDDIIPMLYNETVLFELGAQKVPMTHGNLSIPRQSSGARAYFGGEARPIKTSQPTFDMLHLSSKRLQAMVKMTEELLRSTDISSDALFGNDLLMQMKQGAEHGGLLGTGTKFQPLGLIPNPEIETINLLAISDAQLADSAGRPTADLPIYVRGRVRAKNVIGNSFGWTFNSDAEQYFMRMKSTDGKFIWKEEMDKGTFNGNPYRVTNMIPTDLQNGTTTLVFGNWSDFIFAEQFGLETRTSYEATVQTDEGLVNAFETVQTVTRATMYIDMGVRHDESFIKVTNVKISG